MNLLSILKYISISLLLFVACDLRTQNQAWEETQIDLKRIGIEYVPMYFQIDIRWGNGHYKSWEKDEFIERLKNFSRYLVVREDMVYGYFLVDSLHVIYENIETPYFSPPIDTGR